MKKRKWLLLFALSLCLYGCGEQTAEPEEKHFTVSGGPNLNETEGETLTLSMRVPETLNPLLNREETVDRILKLLFLPLLDFDESGKAVPAVAESWQLSADGKSVTMQLNQGIVWQNGGKLTADDVVFSLNTIRNAPEDSVYKNVLQFVSGCEKAGEYSVVFNFHESFSGNLRSLCFPVISAAYYGGAENGNANMTPVGNGSFRMVSYAQASELLLEASDSYYGTTPQIPAIRVKITAGEETDINAFERGMTDVLVDDAMEAGRYTAEGETGVYSYVSYAYDFIGFNFRRNLFQDKALRQAVAYALPKEELMESVYLQHGVMTNTPVSPKSWLYEENVAPYNYDSAMAATILKNSGWLDANKDGKLEKEAEGQVESLKATILVNQENAARRQIAARLKQELQAIGFEIAIDVQPFGEYEQRFYNGEFDIIVGGWKFSEMADLLPFFTTGGRYNYIGYANEEMDQLLGAAHSAVGEGQTLLAYSSLQKKLAEELPYISIAYRNQAVFASKFVGGEVSPTAFNVFRNIEAWTYDRKAGE